MRRVLAQNTHFCIKIVIPVAQRSEEDSQAILNDGFQRLFNGEESMAATLNRKSAFQEAWNTMNTDITVSVDP